MARARCLGAGPGGTSTHFQGRTRRCVVADGRLDPPGISLSGAGDAGKDPAKAWPDCPAALRTFKMSPNSYVSSPVTRASTFLRAARARARVRSRRRAPRAPGPRAARRRRAARRAAQGECVRACACVCMWAHLSLSLSLSLCACVCACVRVRECVLEDVRDVD
jgi:hypothetical protein